MLGIGDSMIVAVTVYATVWPILINCIDGVRHIESILIDTGRTFGLKRRQILWQIILPGASPYIVTGLRVGLSIALILVTTAEMIAGSKGLGFFILDEERSMNSAARRFCCSPAAMKSTAIFATRPANGAPKKFSATSATRSAFSPTAPCASPAPTIRPWKASNRMTTSAMAPSPSAHFAT